MNEDSSQDRHVKDFWQNQPVEGIRMPVDQIRRRAESFRRSITWRNRREYVAALLVTAVSIYQFFSSEGLVRTGFAFLIAGLFFLTGRLYSAGSAKRLPQDAGVWNWIEYRRRELARQRDLLNSVWRWYLGPLIPGLAILLFAFARANPGHSQHFSLIIAGYVIVVAAVFIFIARLNTAAASELQKEIDDLDHAAEKELV